MRTWVLQQGYLRSFFDVLTEENEGEYGQKVSAPFVIQGFTGNIVALKDIKTDTVYKKVIFPEAVMEFILKGMIVDATIGEKDDKTYIISAGKVYLKRNMNKKTPCVNSYNSPMFYSCKKSPIEGVRPIAISRPFKKALWVVRHSVSSKKKADMVISFVKKYKFDTLLYR